MKFLSMLADAAAPAVQGATQGTAEAGEVAQQPNMLIQLLPFILMIGVVMFVMSRSQKKQAAKRQEMMDRVTKSAKVMLAGGIFGKVIEVRETDCVVEIADGVRVEVLKEAIAKVVDGTEQVVKK